MAMMTWRSGLAVAAIGALGLTLLTAVPGSSDAQAAATEPKKVVAIGDSVMAGFGYYPTSATGTIDDTIPEMKFTDLPGCRPAFTDGFGYNGACSANVLSRTNDDTVAPYVRWAPDYGYWNQVAWSARFARDINTGFSDDSIASAYRNFALSGSTAAEWADDSLVFQRLGSGSDDTGLGAVIAENPDVITITVGANPTLASVLMGEGALKCSAASDKYRCFSELIAKDRTPESLRTVYRTLLENTGAEVIVMLYPNIIPAVTLFTAEDMLIALKALNTTIADAVNDVRDDVRDGDPGWATRIGTVYRYFNTGLPPGSYTAWSPCFGPAALGRGVDGPSNQSSATQQVFAVTRKLTGWCTGTPWIISGDTGIHPNVDGYKAMSDRAVATYSAMVGAVARAVPVLYFADPPQSAQVGESYGPYQFLASGSPLPIFTLADDTSSLPPGMQLTARGSLGGIPTTAGTYSFRVRVSNGIDDTTPVSGTLSIEVRPAPAPAPEPTPVLDPPSAPLGVTAVAGNGSALVTWSAPARSGTSAVAFYEVASVPAGASCLTPATERSCLITGLANGTAYTFTVRARSAAGLSEASEATRSVTPREGAVLITASRGSGPRPQQARVTVTGLAAGIDANQAVVTFRRPRGEVLLTRTVPVSFDGRFSLTRRFPDGVRVVATVDGVTSNAVIIKALARPRR
jgi:lysophospholipase L1-like esterase